MEEWRGKDIAFMGSTRGIFCWANGATLWNMQGILTPGSAGTTYQGFYNYIVKHSSDVNPQFFYFNAEVMSTITDGYFPHGVWGTFLRYGSTSDNMTFILDGLTTSHWRGHVFFYFSAFSEEGPTYFTHKAYDGVYTIHNEGRNPSSSLCTEYVDTTANGHSFIIFQSGNSVTITFCLTLAADASSATVLASGIPKNATSSTVQGSAAVITTTGNFSCPIAVNASSSSQNGINFSLFYPHGGISAGQILRGQITYLTDDPIYDSRNS